MNPKRKTKAPSHLPGHLLQKYIKTGMPKCSGYYVCYTDLKEAWTDVFPISRHQVIFYDGERWSSGDPVLGWIGPLPVLSLDELHSYPPNEAGLLFYYIGTPDEAASFEFKQPLFHQSFSAFLSPGKEGEYIYQYNTRKTGLKKLYKYNPDSEKWQYLGDKKEKQTKAKPKTIKPFKTKELDAPIYAVGTKKEAALENWQHGQTTDFIDAWGGLYEKGEYLWEIRHKSIEPMHIWNNGWGTVSLQQSTRIQKLLKIIRYKHAKRNRTT